MARKRSKDGMGWTLDLFERQAAVEMHRAWKRSEAGWRWTWALAWRDVGAQVNADAMSLATKYPTTCKECEGEGCPDCPADELAAMAERNMRVFGTHDNPIQLEARRKFSTWLADEQRRRRDGDE